MTKEQKPSSPTWAVEGQQWFEEFLNKLRNAGTKHPLLEATDERDEKEGEDV